MSSITYSLNSTEKLHEVKISDFVLQITTSELSVSLEIFDKISWARKGFKSGPRNKDFLKYSCTTKGQEW